MLPVLDRLSRFQRRLMWQFKWQKYVDIINYLLKMSILRQTCSAHIMPITVISLKVWRITQVSCLGIWQLRSINSQIGHLLANWILVVCKTVSKSQRIRIGVLIYYIHMYKIFILISDIYNGTSLCSRICTCGLISEKFPAG